MDSLLDVIYIYRFVILFLLSIIFCIVTIVLKRCKKAKVFSGIIFAVCVTLGVCVAVNNYASPSSFPYGIDDTMVYRLNTALDNCDNIDILTENLGAGTVIEFDSNEEAKRSYLGYYDENNIGDYTGRLSEDSSKLYNYNDDQFFLHCDPILHYKGNLYMPFFETGYYYYTVHIIYNNYKINLYNYSLRLSKYGMDSEIEKIISILEKND